MSSSALTLHQLRSLYLAHARSYYRRADGSATREHLNLETALNHLRHVAGDGVNAADVDREVLRSLRDHLAAHCSRRYVNATIARTLRIFTWAAHRDLVPVSLLAEFAAVERLKAHRSAAREPAPRSPVNPQHVKAALAVMPATSRDLVQLLLLTGARIGELLALRNRDIDTSEHPLWWAMPPWHKSAHLDKRRVIPLDGRCIALLDKYTRPFCPNDFLFASAQRPGQPLRRDSVGNSIRRACRRAGVPNWSLHQLRHAVATTVRQRLNLEAAQALLGHARIDTTELYAQNDQAKSIAAQGVL